MLKKSDFYYDLPREAIAQSAAEPRDSSRLLAYDRKSGVTEHRFFRDIIGYIRRGDLLVVNDTRVINARLAGARESGGRVELLLLRRKDRDVWEVMVKPGKKALPGTALTFAPELRAEIIGKTDGGLRLARFYYDGAFEEVLSRVGAVPLPHYIKGELKDGARYNTVYAARGHSAAAPTAGLHFTRELLGSARRAGAEIAAVTLNVGLGTFRPVKTENVEEHVMHTEEYSVGSETAGAVNRAKADGRRVIAVGTTTVRVLESAAAKGGGVAAGAGETGIFIYPPYKFKVADALITNFHLPESTLLMLVSAFLENGGGANGRETALRLYAAALAAGYRFFSFGDAMLIE